MNKLTTTIQIKTIFEVKKGYYQASETSLETPLPSTYEAFINLLGKSEIANLYRSYLIYYGRGMQDDEKLLIDKSNYESIKEILEAQSSYSETVFIFVSFEGKNIFNFLAYEKKVEIFYIERSDKCLGYANINERSDYDSFMKELNILNFDELKNMCKMIYLDLDRDNIITDPSNFDYIKKEIISNPGKETDVCFVIFTPEMVKENMMSQKDTTKVYDFSIDKSNASWENKSLYALNNVNLEISSEPLKINQSIGFQGLSGMDRLSEKYETSNNMNNSKYYFESAIMSNDPKIPKTIYDSSISEKEKDSFTLKASSKGDAYDKTLDLKTKNLKLKSLDSEKKNSNSNKDKNEGSLNNSNQMKSLTESKKNENNRLMFEGKEIKIKEGSENEFTKNQKNLKCENPNCSNYLIGPKTCKHCSLTFCYKCVSPNSKCLKEYCDNIFEEADIKDVTKKKLMKVKLNCDKECADDDDLSIFNYLEHRNSCQGITL